MLVLGIESSCDETAAAVVKDGKICFQCYCLANNGSFANMAELCRKLPRANILRLSIRY